MSSRPEKLPDDYLPAATREDEPEDPKPKPLQLVKPPPQGTQGKKLKTKPGPVPPKRRKTQWNEDLERGGYSPMPDIEKHDLVGFMPGPVAKAYIIVTLRADRRSGLIKLGGGWLAAKLHCNTRLARRVIARMADAGLIEQTFKGGPKTGPSIYKIVGAADIDYRRAIDVLPQPLRGSRDGEGEGDG